MRLTDLNPAWLTLNGKRVGFIFDCPTRKGWKQTCFVQPTKFKDQEQAIIAVIGDDDEKISFVQRCNPGFGWRVVDTNIVPTKMVDVSIDTAQFETISISPSLNGIWHGNITNGEIVGGLPLHPN
jgi:hypothetical protein